MKFEYLIAETENISEIKIDGGGEFMSPESQYLIDFWYWSVLKYQITVYSLLDSQTFRISCPSLAWIQQEATREPTHSETMRDKAKVI